MFKGFGKQQFTADERQIAGGAFLTNLLKNDKQNLTKINASNNKAHIIYPENDGFLTDSEIKFSLGAMDLRWDLLNPGCPDLVGIRMFTKCGRMKALDATRNCFTAIYDRAKRYVTMSLQIDETGDTSLACVTVDLTGDGPVSIETPERNEKALTRFTHWSIYDMSLSMVPKDDLARRDAIASTLKKLMGNQWDDVFVSV